MPRGPGSAGATPPARAGSPDRSPIRCGTGRVRGSSCFRLRVAVPPREADRVGAQPEAERLDADHVLQRDVPYVHVVAEPVEEPRLLVLPRRLEDHPREAVPLDDGVDDVLPDAAVPMVKADGSALTSFGQH